MNFSLIINLCIKYKYLNRTYGLQVGFSQTNSHLGLGHNGFENFQSQLGSAHTDSHSGLGD